MALARALHFVFKVADRKATSKFYREILGMKVLRHEEFTQGCEAACNGPYDNRWSKTMVGYGPEDTHFVVELTYNYNVHSYKKGNDFIGITIRSREVMARVKASDYPVSLQQDGSALIEAPGGYNFFIINEPEEPGKDPVQKVTLTCSDVINSVAYWKGVLNFELFQQSPDTAVLGTCKEHVQLELKATTKPIDRAEAYGRIAFSVPLNQLSVIEENVRKNNYTVLTPKLSLDTPGKATVTVVILADPDGHEICFVDDENFRLLSQVDPEGEILLDRYIKKDDERQKAS